MSQAIIRFGGGITSCADDVGICCFGFCCPFCQFGQVQEYTGDNCCVCCCAMMICAEVGCHTCLHASQRDKLEVKLEGQPRGLFGQLCCDTCCCGWCAICQEARAVKAHQNRPPPMQVQPQQQPMVVSVNVGQPAPPPQQPVYAGPGYAPPPPAASGMLPPHILADFKQSLEAEYVHNRGACVGGFFQRHSHELAPHQSQWCDQQENICRSNPNHVYSL